MRSTRLLRLLALLQTRRRLTAELCAEELEVSTRTIYRDLDTLLASGVPVQSERGPGGGVALATGWSTPVPRLEDDEVTALAAFSAPLALAGLGLSAPLERALEKITASLPELQRAAAERAQGRLHIDPSAWFTAPDTTEHLALLRSACFENRRVLVDYRSTEGGRRERALEPLGLVLKGAQWYLVALEVEPPPGAAQARVFRGSRIAHVRSLEERFERPPRFSLARFWRRWTREFLEARPSFPVNLRLTPAAAARLAGERPEPERSALRALAARRRPGRARLDFERRAIALAQLVTLGEEAEVLSPRSLRAELADKARAWLRLYGPRSEQGPRARR